MTISDDLGRIVTFSGPLRRIVSLAPAATENLFAVGAGALLVGGTTADDYPPAALKLPRVGDFYKPSYERILALHPDLILVDSATADKAAMDNLQSRVRAPVFVQVSRRYTDVEKHLAQLGTLTGRAGQAKAVSEKMRVQTRAAERRVSGKKPVTVFVQIDTSALYAAGPGTFIDDLIHRAGGLNIVRGTNPFPIVSKETVLVANPDFYLVTIPFVGNQPAAVPPLPAGLGNLRAIREKRVFYLDANLLSRPTPRLADGLFRLAAVLHP